MGNSVGMGNVHGFHWTKKDAVDFISTMTGVSKEELNKMNGKACIRLAVELKVIQLNMK